MKMSAPHFAELMLMILAEFDNKNINDYLEHQRSLELSEKRIRWDILWNVPMSSRQTWFDEVYKYCDDNHIDTSLKKIINSLYL